jgi:hypothetical protein
MQSVGFLVLLLVVGLLVKAATLAANDAEVVAGIAAYSPWLAAHADVLALLVCASAGGVMIAGLAISEP